MRNSEHEARYFWLTAVVIVLVLFALLVFPKFLRNRENTQVSSLTATSTGVTATPPPSQIQFPAVTKRAAFSLQNPSTEISTFLVPTANYYAGQYLTYQNGSVGFYFRYSVASTSAETLVNDVESSVIQNGWTVLDVATSSEPAILEVSSVVGKSDWRTRITYEDQSDGSVMVIMQSIITVSSS